MRLTKNRMKQHDRLAPYLLCATAAHALAVYALKTPSPPPTPESQALEFEVTLSPTPIPKAPNTAAELAPAIVRQTGEARGGQRMVIARPLPSIPIAHQPAEIEPVAGLAVEKHPTPPSPPTPSATSRTIHIQTLLDSARQIGKEEERSAPAQKNSHASLAERPILEKLATILAGPDASPPGTTKYADGTIKVVTAYGTVYCTKSAQDLARTGPLAPENMAMTCP